MNNFVVAFLGIVVRDLFLMPNKWFQGRLCIVYKKRLVRMSCRARTSIYVMKPAKSTQEKMWFNDFAFERADQCRTTSNIFGRVRFRTKKNTEKTQVNYRQFSNFFFRYFAFSGNVSHNKIEKSIFLSFFVRNQFGWAEFSDAKRMMDRIWKWKMPNPRKFCGA